jgi:hypothetical protein
MENDVPQSPPSNSSKIITGVLLFCYFGFIAIPEFARPISEQFLFWIILFPFVFGAVIITGIRGGIGLWREKHRNAVPNPYNRHRIWFASLSILWCLTSLGLSGFTYRAYLHPQFDSEKWKSSDWEEGGMLEPSTRERMLEDLMTNELPGRSKTEIIEMLGQPDELRDVDGEETLFYYTSWNIMEPKCLFINFDSIEIVKEYALSVCGLTMRAPDLGWAPRKRRILANSPFLFRGFVLPAVGNASRWAGRKRQRIWFERWHSFFN